MTPREIAPAFGHRRLRWFRALG